MQSQPLKKEICGAKGKNLEILSVTKRLTLSLASVRYQSSLGIGFDFPNHGKAVVGPWA